jgi:hypothetical protein
MSHVYLEHLITPNLGIEIIYSFIIIVCSLMIYFGTKELYELSSHKGIKYFRQTFLFFALAYFLRSFIKFISVYFNTAEIFNICPCMLNVSLGYISLFLFIYLASVAIFSLIFSICHKKISKINFAHFHLIAILIGILAVYLNNHTAYLIINIILLLTILGAIIACGEKVKKNKLFPAYLLLIIFWILNIIDLLVPSIIQPFQLAIYLVSISTFLLILYKVLTKLGSN